MKSVNEVAKLAGVSKRTLRYYDEIGLLVPSAATRAGYRQYGGEDLARLWQILFYREMGLSLRKIAGMLDAQPAQRLTALRLHRAVLEKQAARLGGIIRSIDRILKGEFEETMLNDFDMTEIERAKERYGREAQERWGGTDAYRESAKRTAAYTPEDWARIKAEQEAVYGDFIAAMDKGCESAEAQAAVKRLQKCLNDNFYNCTDEILAGLGQMYVSDERFTKNIDRHKEGLAAFISASISGFCGSGGK